MSQRYKEAAKHPVVPQERKEPKYPHVLLTAFGKDHEDHMISRQHNRHGGKRPAVPKKGGMQHSAFNVCLLPAAQTAEGSSQCRRPGSSPQGGAPRATPSEQMFFMTKAVIIAVNLT